jgi:hypothetical protein
MERWITGGDLGTDLDACDYCRIQIKSTPLRDHDTLDENFLSSPCLDERDKGKFSSDMSACGAFLGGVYGGGTPLEQKLRVY